MNKPDAISHYETQARAALYPELVKALELIIKTATSAIKSKSRDVDDWIDDVQAIRDTATATLSRLPAERDKGAG